MKLVDHNCQQTKQKLMNRKAMRNEGNNANGNRRSNNHQSIKMYKHATKICITTVISTKHNAENH